MSLKILVGQQRRIQQYSKMVLLRNFQNLMLYNVTNAVASPACAARYLNQTLLVPTNFQIFNTPNQATANSFKRMRNAS